MREHKFKPDGVCDDCGVYFDSATADYVYPGKARWVATPHKPSCPPTASETEAGEKASNRPVRR